MVKMCLVFDESPQIPKKFRHRTTSYSSTSVLPPQHPITYPPRLTTSTLSLLLNTTSQLRRTHPCISETEPLHISNNTLSSHLVKTTSHNTRSLLSVTRPTHHRLGAASHPPPSTPPLSFTTHNSVFCRSLPSRSYSNTSAPTFANFGLPFSPPSSLYLTSTFASSLFNHCDSFYTTCGNTSGSSFTLACYFSSMELRFQTSTL